MKKIALTILFTLLASPAWGTTYYIAPASSGGNDSNNGISPSTPWLTPNHPVNCGDVILAAASTSYSDANFYMGKWGTVTCSAGNNVAWLKCATFDACKITASDGNQGMWIDKSYWGVQGWEITTTFGAYAGCFSAFPNYSTPVEIHHIIFANDIANGCQGSGFVSTNDGTTASVDYFAVIGNIAYNTTQGNGECFSGINIFQPIASDTLPGTHIFIAGNFSYENFDPNPCAGGTPTDGEGIVLDTLDGVPGGLPTAYAQQVAVVNNLVFLNGGRGIQLGGHGNTAAPVYIRQNTSYGSNGDRNQTAYFCSEISLGGQVGTVNTQAYFNLAASTTDAGCGGLSPVFAWTVDNSGTADLVNNNWISGINGSNTLVYNSGTFAYGPKNTLGISPSFSNPVNPGAPSCGSASSVPNCMATVIANFTPTTPAAKAYGYQIPSTSKATDPLFPQWLCNVNLPTGLVTMGCTAASSLPSSPSITGVKVQ